MPDVAPLNLRLILQQSNEVGRLQAANEYGISPVTIENWSWKFEMKTPPKYGTDKLGKKLKA